MIIDGHEEVPEPTVDEGGGLADKPDVDAAGNLGRRRIDKSLALHGITRTEIGTILNR